MGEYWKPVNLTRREWIHPHHVDCGLKLGEWNYPGSPVRTIMAERWSPTDDVRALSDYGGEIQLSGCARGVKAPDYEDLEDDFIEIGSTEPRETDDA